MYSAFVAAAGSRPRVEAATQHASRPVCRGNTLVLGGFREESGVREAPAGSIFGQFSAEFGLETSLNRRASLSGLVGKSIWPNMHKFLMHKL